MNVNQTAPDSTSYHAHEFASLEKGWPSDSAPMQLSLFQALTAISVNESVPEDRLAAHVTPLACHIPDPGLGDDLSGADQVVFARIHSELAEPIPESIKSILPQHSAFSTEGERRLALTLLRSSIEDMARLDTLRRSPGTARRVSRDQMEELLENERWLTTGDEGLISFRAACWIIGPSVNYRTIQRAVLADPVNVLDRLRVENRALLAQAAHQASLEAAEVAAAEQGSEDQMVESGLCNY